MSASLHINDLEFSVDSVTTPRAVRANSPVAPRQTVPASVSAATPVAEAITAAKPAPGAFKAQKRVPAGSLMDYELYSPGEFGLAERFYDLKGNAFKYIPEYASWTCFENGVWVKTKTKAKKAMLETVKKMGKEILAAKDDAGKDEDSAKTFAYREKFYNASCTDHTLNASLSVAACEPEFEEAAAKFDMAPMHFNAPNGTFDIEAGKLESHNPAHLFTKMGKANVGDEGSQCPKFHAFVKWMSLDRPELKEFLLTFMGYSLTASVRERKALFLFGEGNNGKGVLTKVMAELMGLGEFMSVLPFSVMQAKPLDNSIPVELAASAGKRLIIVNEAGKGQWLNEPEFKEQVSGDPKMARFMRADPFLFFPVAKYWFCTNHPILIRSNDEAMWQRVIVVPCEARVTGAAVNTRLLEDLLEEKEAILRLLLTYAHKWATEGLTIPQCVVDATAQYRASMDEFAGFIAENLERGPTFQMSKSQAFELYLAWAKSENIKMAMKKSTFKAMLIERGFVDKHTNKGDVWVGIRAKVVGDGTTAVAPLEARQELCFDVTA